MLLLVIALVVLLYALVGFAFAVHQYPRLARYEREDGMHLLYGALWPLYGAAAAFIWVIQALDTLVAGVSDWIAGRDDTTTPASKDARR